MIDRNLLREIDWTLVGMLLLFSALGIVLIYSSSHFLEGHFYLKQLLWVVLSFGILFAWISIDYKYLLSFSYVFYILAILVLAGMLIFGKAVAGAKSWIRIAFVGGQPSELTKIVLILILAKVFSRIKTRYVSWGMIFLGGSLTILPMILVAFQPDLGTAISLAPLLVAALLLAGMNRKALVYLLLAAILLGVVGWNFLLKDYQRKRLTTLIFPGKDPLGTGYHILQSRIAIGSGGLFGKGFKKGTQSQLRFLPARHTDFIFSVLGEEFGFAGVSVIMALYFLFLSRLFRSTNKSGDRAGVYIVFMVAMMISFQFFINVMMMIGLFPITGIPLPLLSYGGSSLLTAFLAVGLVLNVKMHRFANL